MVQNVLFSIIRKLTTWPKRCRANKGGVIKLKAEKIQDRRTSQTEFYFGSFHQNLVIHKKCSCSPTTTKNNLDRVNHATSSR